MGTRSAILLVLALLAPSLAFASSAEACATGAGVPCGRIYPIILMAIDGQAPTYDLAAGEPLELTATLTYKFDVANEGYTVATPNEPVKISFEFPRKPAWAELKVEPEFIDVPVNDPTYIQPDVSNPASPQAQYVWTTQIKITASLVGQPVLKDGYDYQKLLVFAKSTESGLFQSGYGIKEVRVVPEGALHESDIAGTRDVFTASPLPALSPEAVARTAAGTTVTLTPPADVAFWQPAPFEVAVEPAPSGRMMAAVHDEAGNLVAQSGLVDASTGRMALNVTLVRPGLHTATVTILPGPGSADPPLTFALDFAAGDTRAEGHEFPKAMLVTASDTVPAPVGNSEFALTQFERDIPFFAFDTAQSVTATLSLATSGADAAGLGAANLQFAIHDPEGKLLQLASVDPSVPTKGIRIGSLPGEGWYTLRVSGAGAPSLSAYHARIEVLYAVAPQARSLADGVADRTGGNLPHAGVNLTLPVETLQVWAPGDFTPALSSGAAFRHALSVYDANGTLVMGAASREGEARFSPPAPGVYRAFVFLEPTTPGTPFSPLVRAFTFSVGDGTTTLVQTYSLQDAFAVPPGPAGALVGVYALPEVPDGKPTAIDATNLRVEEVDEKGRRMLYVYSAGGPQGGEASFEHAVDYPSPVSLVGAQPLSPNDAPAGLPIPALGLGLLALGAVAVAVMGMTEETRQPPSGERNRKSATPNNPPRSNMPQ